MAADSVGQIGLDLVINKNGFDKQLVGIQSLAKKTGKILAAAFTVKKLADFGKECIELGSDLAEVQNVVNVVFPNMNKQIDSFAKNAAAQFGLSETDGRKNLLEPSEQCQKHLGSMRRRILTCLRL